MIDTNTKKRLLKLDHNISASIRIAENQGLVRKTAAILAHSGDSWIWIIGLVLLWLRGTTFWSAQAATLGIGVFVSGIIVALIKVFIRRGRPKGEWGSMYRITDPHSFPSGHAARAGVLATMAIGLGPAWFAIILTVWAPLVGLARVAMGVHYISDVASGMVLGIMIGLTVLLSTN